jgi:two-component sensor histidine kinase
MPSKRFLLYCLLLFCNKPIIAQKPIFKTIRINDSLFTEFSPTTFDITEQNLRISIHHFPNDTTYYQYQFVGIDKNWNDYQLQNNIYYHELPGGLFPFTIRQKANPQISKSILINIKPQLWQKWWFLPSIYLIFLLIIGSALYFMFLYRLRQEVQMRQVRNHIASDLHDEIGATLSGIGILSTLAQQQLKDSHPSYALMQRIAEDALNIGNTMDDIVWSINPKNDDLENIIARMSRFAAELFDAKDIDYQIIIPQNIAEAKLTMEQRRDVYLIFKEAVNNLVKYSRCRKAVLEITLNQQLFELRISDDGIGFDVHKSTHRNGIKNMRARAENLKGSLKVESEFSQGTSITLKFSI